MKNKILLSICIPTYNREKHLESCLQSIYNAKKKLNKKFSFEVCISDNNSEYNPKKLYVNYKRHLNLKFNQNKKNIGYALNYLKLLNIASGEYVWFIGDDDILLPNSLLEVSNLISKYDQHDVFFVNSLNTSANNVFNGKILDKLKVKKFSKIRSNKSLNFIDLIDHKVSFDFLLGMYLIIYKKKRAIKNAKEIYKKYYKELSKKGIWSTFENTCIQCILYSKTFMRSKAYMFSKPITANLSGIREWGGMYYFIEIVRIPELLDQYKKNGLPLKKYLKLKNASLKNFFYCFFKIFLGKKEDGFAYIKWKKNFLYNLIYPNIYIYLIVYLFSLIKRKYVKY